MGQYAIDLRRGTVLLTGDYGFVTYVCSNVLHNYQSMGGDNGCFNLPILQFLLLMLTRWIRSLYQRGSEKVRVNQKHVPCCSSRAVLRRNRGPLCILRHLRHRHTERWPLQSRPGYVPCWRLHSFRSSWTSIRSIQHVNWATYGGVHHVLYEYIYIYIYIYIVCFLFIYLFGQQQVRANWSCSLGRHWFQWTCCHFPLWMSL